MSKQQTHSIEEIRDLLTGPVNSIPTTFTKHSDLDLDGIRNLVEAGIAGGSSVTLITYGDSQLEFLNDDEVLLLTRTIAEQSAGRSLTVAATSYWPTKKSVEFAKACRKLGVDVLMLTMGLYTAASADARLAECHLTVAEEMPVMIVGYPDHKLLDQLLDEPRICCFKEDGTVEYAVDTMRRYGGRWKFMTGGGLWRNFTQWPLGCRAFMSPWCSIKPEVNQRYYEAMQRNDLKTACEVITKLDFPLFGLCAHYTGGWQTAWRAILETMGLAQRYRRAPMPSATDADLERIKDDLRPLRG